MSNYAPIVCIYSSMSEDDGLAVAFTYEKIGFILPEPPCTKVRKGAQWSGIWGDFEDELKLRVFDLNYNVMAQEQFSGQATKLHVFEIIKLERCLGKETQAFLYQIDQAYLLAFMLSNPAIEAVKNNLRGFRSVVDLHMIVWLLSPTEKPIYLGGQTETAFGITEPRYEKWCTGKGLWSGDSEEEEPDFD